MSAHCDLCDAEGHWVKECPGLGVARSRLRGEGQGARQYSEVVRAEGDPSRVNEPIPAYGIGSLGQGRGVVTLGYGSGNQYQQGDEAQVKGGLTNNLGYQGALN